MPEMGTSPEHPPALDRVQLCPGQGREAESRSGPRREGLQLVALLQDGRVHDEVQVRRQATVHRVPTEMGDVVRLMTAEVGLEEEQARTCHAAAPPRDGYG